MAGVLFTPTCSMPAGDRVCSHDLRGRGRGRSVHTCRPVRGWLFFGLRLGHRRRGEGAGERPASPEVGVPSPRALVGCRRGGWVSRRGAGSGPVVIAVDPHKRSWPRWRWTGRYSCRPRSGSRPIGRASGSCAGSPGDGRCRGGRSRCGRVGCAAGDTAVGRWAGGAGRAGEAGRAGAGALDGGGQRLLAEDDRDAVASGPRVRDQPARRARRVTDRLRPARPVAGGCVMAAAHDT